MTSRPELWVLGRRGHTDLPIGVPDVLCRPLVAGGAAPDRAVCAGWLTVLDELAGGLLGGGLGARLRASYVRRKEDRATSDRDVRLPARAHPTGAPDWRYWRGALVRRRGLVRWRPWIRRWRSFELNGGVLVGTRTRRSAADGDRSLLELEPGAQADHLAVPIDCTQIAEALLRPGHDVSP
jgi:hypothetical protein